MIHIPFTRLLQLIGRFSRFIYIHSFRYYLNSVSNLIFLGSILAVEVADKFAPNGTHRFVGICIERYNEGLWTTFTLRNVIEKTGTWTVDSFVLLIISYHHICLSFARIEHHLSDTILFSLLISTGRFWGRIVGKWFSIGSAVLYVHNDKHQLRVFRFT